MMDSEDTVTLWTENIVQDLRVMKNLTEELHYL